MHDDHDDHEDHDHDEHGNPVDEHSALHLELHRAVDELGKYAIEIEFDPKGGIPKERMKQFIDDLMRTVTANCMNNGADLVGHVKSFLLVDDGNIMSSIVDENKPTRIKDAVESDTIHKSKFVLHVIVHGIWDDKIRSLTLEVLPGICRKWNMPYRIIADYFDVEKSIAHHT